MSESRGVVGAPIPGNDDVIISILSKLPAVCVLKCRKVCRQWRVLTSTPYFAQLHFKEVVTKASQSLIVGHCMCLKRSLILFIVDGKVIKKVCVRSTGKTEQDDCILVGSCNGLLLFAAALAPTVFYIVNPITQEQVLVKIPAPALFCGFFFHPLTSKYKILYRRRRHSGQIQYVLCCVNTKTSKQVVTSFAYRPMRYYAPANVNGALHWMVDWNNHKSDNSCCANAIMVFTFDTEDFHALPHPGGECLSRDRLHRWTRLLEMEGQLCFCRVFYSGDKRIDIWVLEDYANWVWVRRYMVDLDLVWDVRRFPYEKDAPGPGPEPLFGYNIQFLNIQNGELLLFWLWRGLFLCNLELNTVRKIRTGETDYRYLEQYLCGTTFTGSLVSFK